MTWRVEQYGHLPSLVVNQESCRSIGWFTDVREAHVVCAALNEYERRMTTVNAVPVVPQWPPVPQ